MVQDLITQLSDRGHSKIKHITFCDKERKSEKRSGLDIYSSNLISYTLTDFRSWQAQVWKSTNFDAGLYDITGFLWALIISI